MPNHLIHDSSSLSVHSSTNASFYYETNQLPPVINADSTSIQSDDSSTFSEGHLHPSQQGNTFNSIRNHDLGSNSKYRPVQADLSLSSAGKIRNNLINL
jgi:hypothetical protein